MAARFVGPYSMPRGASGRVPPTSGGTLSPADTPRKGFTYPKSGYPSRVPGGWRYWGGGYRAPRDLGRYGSGWAYGMAALANIDPSKSRSAARAANAAIAQWLPWQTGPLEDPFAGWGVGIIDDSLVDFPYQLDGSWTITCNFDPAVAHPFEPIRKLGVTPAPPGYPAIASAFCDVSSVGNSNFPWGSTIPGGSGASRIIVLTQSSTAAAGNRNGRPYFRATHPSSPAAAPIPYTPGKVILPVADPMTEVQMEAHPQGRTSNKVRLMTGYQTAAMTVTIPGRGPPTKNPDDVHNRVPPGPKEREEKPMDKTGRSVKEVYGAMTEIGDALDCMQKSMKKGSGYKQFGNVKRVPVNQRLDLKALRMAQAAASGQIDWGKFVECMAVNDFKDRVIGGLGGGAARQLNRSPYAPKGRAYRGYGVGGGSTRMR